MSDCAEDCRNIDCVLDCFLDCLSKSCIDERDAPDGANFSFALNIADVDSADASLLILEDIELDVLLRSNLWIDDVLPAGLDIPPPPSPALEPHVAFCAPDDPRPLPPPIALFIPDRLPLLFWTIAAAACSAFMLKDASREFDPYLALRARASKPSLLLDLKPFLLARWTLWLKLCNDGFDPFRLKLL